MYLIWILGSKLLLSNNQSKATLWVLDTCLIITASVILKDVQHRTKSRKLRVRRDVINITQIKIVVLGWNLGLVLVVLV